MDDSQKQTMEDVLCILTCEVFIILEMREIEERDSREVRPPPLKKIIKFADENLPVRMGCLKLKNAVYMFGGEFLTEKPCMWNPAYDVVKLDLCDPHSKPAYVGKLKAPKLFPLVFEFNSKIYILSALPYSFEVWDPVTAESFLLPSSPSRFCSVNGYFLTEKGIVMAVHNSPKALFFNIHDEKWETLSELWKRPPSMNLQDWGSLHGVQAAGNNDFVLRVRGGKIILVNIRKPWAKTQSWDLTDRYRYCDLKGEYCVEPHLTRIVGTSKQRPRYNCLILPLFNYKEDTMRIIIDVFRVGRNASSSKRHKLDGPCQEGSMPPRGEELFSLISVRKHVYEFNYHKSPDRFHLNYLHFADIWSLPEVSGTSKENMEGSNDRSANAEVAVSSGDPWPNM